MAIRAAQTMIPPVLVPMPARKVLEVAPFFCAVLDITNATMLTMMPDATAMTALMLFP